MKKTMFVLLCALTMSSSAFAHTYSCGTLKNAEGSPILGSPGYAVEIDGQDVLLQVVTGADEGQPLTTEKFKMEKISQEVEGATFEAQGVSALVLYIPRQGRASTTVSISKKVGDETVSASCN